MLNSQLKSELLIVVERCYRTAEQCLGRQFPRPEVLFNQRGKIAGCALLQKNMLKFHPKIYEQNKAHFLEHVVPHEIAHLLVWQVFGKTAPHGRQWQHMMVNVFNVPPSRTHQYNVDDIGIKHITYRCDCGDIKLTMRRHNNVLKGTIYRCKTCRQNLMIA
ncbi:MAG: hypothetical protein BM565_09740 [Gammaproteobacteria bacterium MedPE]|nr:MAG: hypothetical protein BM565_09740 [Gammaproteobacteria bacterium MedPE]